VRVSVTRRHLDEARRAAGEADAASQGARCLVGERGRTVALGTSGCLLGRGRTPGYCHYCMAFATGSVDPGPPLPLRTHAV
jgi:hypothetical protein